MRCVVVHEYWTMSISMLILSVVTLIHFRRGRGRFIIETFCAFSLFENIIFRLNWIVGVLSQKMSSKIDCYNESRSSQASPEP